MSLRKRISFGIPNNHQVCCFTLDTGEGLSPKVVFKDGKTVNAFRDVQECMRVIKGEVGPIPPGSIKAFPSEISICLKFYPAEFPEFKADGPPPTEEGSMLKGEATASADGYLDVTDAFFLFLGGGSTEVGALWCSNYASYFFKVHEGTNRFEQYKHTYKLTLYRNLFVVRYYVESHRQYEQPVMI